MKIFFCGGLSALLAFQPVVSPLMAYAGLPDLPKEEPLKYSDELKKRFEDLEVCVSEAETEILGETLTKDPLTKSCSDVANEYGLSWKVNENDSNYAKETAQLKASVDLFVKMGQEAGDEDRMLKFEKVNDQWDMLFYRIFNLLYEIPKVQGHPMILEFSKSSRDVYLRHGKFTYFRNICYYFYHNNKDKELTRDLLRFVYHLEESDYFMDIDLYTPDENSNVYLPGEPIPGPEVPEDFVTPEEQEKEDLESAWEETWEEIEKEELEENPPVVVPSPKPIPTTETYTSYELEGNVCMKVVTVVVDGVSKGTTKTKATNSEKLNCRRVEDIIWDDFESTESTEELDENVIEFVKQEVVFYRMEKDGESYMTEIVSDYHLFDYDLLVDLLDVISSDHGLGSLGGDERHLFVIEGKALILNAFEGEKSVDEINQWLKEKGFSIEIYFDLNETIEEETSGQK